MLRAGSAARSPAPSGVAPGVDDRRQVARAGRRCARRGEAGDEPLERLTHFEQLGRPSVGEHHHPRAAPRLDVDEAFAGERLQRLAHRVAADAELLGELVLEDAIALGQRPAMIRRRISSRTTIRSG